MRVHVLSPFPVNSLFDSLPADVWNGFVVHRHNISDITADLVSATLARELVRLDVLLSVHHEASNDSPSLDSVLFRLPVSEKCFVSEMKDGNFSCGQGMAVSESRTRMLQDQLRYRRA